MLLYIPIWIIISILQTFEILPPVRGAENVENVKKLEFSNLW